MKKITWKRFMISVAILCISCLICIVTDNIYFFFLGIAAFLIIMIAPFIG